MALSTTHGQEDCSREFGGLVKKLQMYRTPETPSFHIVRPKEGDYALDEDMQKKYRSGIGMVLFLVKHSRPDLVNMIYELVKLMKELLQVVKFMLDTQHMGLKLELVIANGKLIWRLVGYSDNNWAGDKDA